MIDWEAVFFDAQQQQPKIVQDIRSFVLYAIAPQKCHFTGNNLEGACFVIMLQIKRKTFALLCEKQFYFNNHQRIKNFLMIHQDFHMAPSVCNIVEAVPNFANYRPWLTPQVTFVHGSLKDVDTSKSLTVDRTRFAGRESVEPDFLETAQRITHERIEQLDYHPNAVEVLSLLDDIQSAKIVHREPMLLEAKHE